MKTPVEDEESLELRAMAEGSKPFRRLGVWERLSQMPLPGIKRLGARERLAIGYYTAALRRVESLKGDVPA